MAWVRVIAPWLARSDARSAAQIEREIDDEIAFHIEMRAADLVASGMSAQAAQREAKTRFGDVGRVRARCKEVQMAERMVVQKIQAVLIAVLVAALIGVVWYARTARMRSLAELARMKAEVASLNVALRQRSGDGRLVMDDELAADLAAAVAGIASGKGSIGRLLADEGISASTAHVVSNDEWLARFRAAKSWRDGLAIGEEIAKLPDDAALSVMCAIYHDIPTVQCRQQVLKAFVFDGAKPYACEVLDLAATDKDLAVQGWAFTYLQRIALSDFSSDYSAYQGWRSRTAGKPLGEVLASSATEFLNRARTETGDALLADLRLFSRFDEQAVKRHAPDLPDSLARQGALDLAATWIATDNSRLQDKAIAFAVRAGADEAFLVRSIDPLLASDSTASDVVQAAAVRAVASARGRGAVPELLDFLSRSISDLDAHGIAASTASEALGDIPDGGALPWLLAILVDNDRPEVHRVLDVQVLQKLTGVAPDAAHGAAFWLKWWDENQQRLPAYVRGRPIPYQKAR